MSLPLERVLAQLSGFKTLLIISGVSASGKSTLMALLQERNNLLHDQLALHNRDSALYIDSGKVSDLNLLQDLHSAQEVVLHFDFMHHAMIMPVGFKLLERMIQLAEHSQALTLCASSQRLTQRQNERMSQEYQFYATGDQRWQSLLRYQQAKFKLYHCPQSLLAYYQKWSQVLSEHSIKAHHLLDSSAPELKWLGAYHPQKVQQILHKQASRQKMP